MALHEIVYVSQAGEEMTKQQLSALLIRSRLKNEKSGITGVLFYHQCEFIQLLEGEADAVNALFEQIKADQRHQRVYKLWDNPISERSYTNWSMAFVARDWMEHKPQTV